MTDEEHAPNASARVTAAAAELEEEDNDGNHSNPNACDPSLVTPECLRHFYGAGHWKPKPIQDQLDIVTILLGGAGSDGADLQA